MMAKPGVLFLWPLFFLIMSFTTAYSYPYYGPSEAVEEKIPEPVLSHEYTRYPEVENACKSILLSASTREIGVAGVVGMKQELSFVRGDWRQESGDAPLLPFDGSDAPQNATDLPDPIRLVTFTLMHVDTVHGSRKAVNVSGVLSIGISSNGTAPDIGRYLSPEFLLWPGSSELRIVFEGVYVESEANGGERVMCMLGTSNLPSRQPDSTYPGEWVKDSHTGNYHLVQDDRILLVLRYPTTFTLTTRAIHGEMWSLSQKSSLGYFDKLLLSSQLGAYSNYHYGSEKIVSRACSPYPFPDDIVDGRFQIYKGTRFCEILDRFFSGELLNVVPNWNCNSTDEFCRKLGPFSSEHKIRATDGGFTNVGLMMQDVRCEPSSARNNVSSARVSAVFRVVLPWENQYMAVQRTGLSGMTLSAEGMWKPFSGQLCMVGCIGLADEGCHSRICLYIPISFSISQRNIVYGRIMSIDDGRASSFFPLSFERPAHPSELWNKFSNSHLSYKYSKIKSAGAFLERSEPFDFSAIVKKSLLSYPRKVEGSDEQVALSNLADDLTLHVPAVPDPLPKVRTERPFLQMEILSLDTMFGRYWVMLNATVADGSAPALAKAESTEKQLLLNVSAELSLIGKAYSNVSVLYLEGLYNPVDGKMYLIGCRDVRAPWKILFDSMDLEYGLDCLVEVKVEYPPTTARWLMNPTAKVSITSRRNDDDPLHFSPIKLQTLPILYRQQREDILSRRGVEGILRILTLSVAIACILGQLFYVRDNTSSVPYISFVMLGVQSLGYSIPLITGAEALFARMVSESYDAPSYDLEKNQWFQIIDYVVKILVLGAFLLTLRLGQRVWKSRIRLLSRAPLEPWRVPNDKRVCLISFTIHLVGFLVVLVVHNVNAAQRPIQPEKYMDPRGNSHRLHEWGVKLEEYVGLIQDFFLLPQIIGNLLWQINCKPLRKTYYVGITVVRLLPHVYDYIRAPIFNPYFSEEYEFVNPSLDFYSKFGDVAIPVTATVLAVVVYIQQKWGCQKLSLNLRPGQKSLLPLGSRVYERLPSLSFEAELVSGVNETPAQDSLEKAEE